MPAEVIQVDSSNVRISLGRFRASLEQEEQMTNQIGMYMLGSVRRTFREQGSPARSWMPLAPSTIKKDKKKYGSGHQLLIDKGTLLNSISYRSYRGGVSIGTNLKYAAVHQFGSRDRGAIGFGPRTEAMDKATVKVKASESYQTRSLGNGRMAQTDKLGRTSRRKRVVIGPRNRKLVKVSAHVRHQNIPARPYLVFRPEDPAKIRTLVNAFVLRARRAAKLEGN